MVEINVGDRVRVQNRPDWPSPPGYRLAGSEGVVTRVFKSTGLKISQDYIEVRLQKTKADLDINRPYNFRREALAKI
jgi:hypothetical protein